MKGNECCKRMRAIYRPSITESLEVWGTHAGLHRHKGFLSGASFRACSRVHILEALQLELLFVRFLCLLNLHANGVIRVQLSVGHSDTDSTLCVSFLLIRDSKLVVLESQIATTN